MSKTDIEEGRFFWSSTQTSDRDEISFFPIFKFPISALIRGENQGVI